MEKLRDILNAQFDLLLFVGNCHGPSMLPLGATINVRLAARDSFAVDVLMKVNF
jgi:hypothetical protein